MNHTNEKPYSKIDHRGIKLKNGGFSSIDMEDYESLKDFSWVKAKRGNTAYAVTNHRTSGKDKSIYMHRMIIKAPKGVLVDHIDGNGLNNTKSNLRLSNKSQNALNSLKHRNGLTIGVKKTIGRRKKRYWAYITIKNKQTSPGYFLTFSEAKSVYIKKLESISNV